MYKSTKSFAVLLSMVFILKTFSTHAQHTIIPDSTYGINGVHAMYDSIYNRPYCMDIQPDGKVVVGTSGNYIAIARYNADGSVDTTFGSKGFREINQYGYSTQIYAVKVLPSGKILANGTEYSGTNSANFIVRITASGKIDSSFGTFGFTVMGTLQYPLSDMKILSNGSIRYLFYNTTTSSFSPAVMKLDSNGVIDNVFGTKTISRIVCGSTIAFFALDHSDRLIIAGRDSNNAWVLGGMLPNGNYDNTFGVNGFATINTVGTNTITQNSVRAITTAIHPDNSIAVVLRYNTSYGDIFAAHIFANGTQDNTYGQGGLAATFANKTIVYLNLVNALSLDNNSLIIQTSNHFNGFFDRSQLEVLTAAGQHDLVFPNHTDSLVISYDTPNGAGAVLTTTGNIMKVPNRNQLMLFAIGSYANKRYLSRFSYTGFVNGIDNIEATLDINIYPNPTAGVYSIYIPSHSNQSYSAQLIDITGKVISTAWNLVDGVNTFSTDFYDRGLYIVRISDNHGVIMTKKVIIE